ncbi:hypothetical protein NDU88_004785 [Pleurodeles waltl]|uniref:Uncharacterized protein n=1 Tax=Pleurodeles waltl TaxID=8319 RepID=A0AAV7W681_PLEWA|nr:hypothetical protein NDU88_004785 [Pleurodeles waltl]
MLTGSGDSRSMTPTPYGLPGRGNAKKNASLLRITTDRGEIYGGAQLRVADMVLGETGRREGENTCLEVVRVEPRAGPLLVRLAAWAEATGWLKEGGAMGVGLLCAAEKERVSVLQGRRPRVRCHAAGAGSVPMAVGVSAPEGRGAESEAWEAAGLGTLISNFKVDEQKQKE